VLAAGGSRRMGSPKALLRFDGQPWIMHHVRALAPEVDRVRVVLGAQAEAIRAVLPPEVEVLLNPDWARTGMAESLALALAGLEDQARVLVTPVDVPPAPAWVLQALLAAGGAVVPTCEGHDAHPVVVMAGPTRAALPGHTLREVLATAPRKELGWAEGLQNLNTSEDFQRWRAG